MSKTEYNNALIEYIQKIKPKSFDLKKNSSSFWTQQMQHSNFYLPATLAKSITEINAWNEMHKINYCLPSTLAIPTLAKKKNPFKWKGFTINTFSSNCLVSYSDFSVL